MQKLKHVRATFTVWLFAQGARDDFVGDLAFNAARDRTWPTKATTYKAFRSYLESCRACVRALDGFDQG